MAGALISCPNCRSTLTFGQGVPANATLRCPICETTFAVRPAAPPAPAPAKVAPTPPAAPIPQAPAAKSAAAPRPAVPAPVVRPARAAGPQPTATPPSAPARCNGKRIPRPAVAVPASRAPRVLGGVIIAAVALALLCVLAVVVWTQLFGDRPTQTKDPGKLGPVALNTPIDGPTPPAIEEDPSKPAVSTTPAAPAPVVRPARSASPPLTATPPSAPARRNGRSIPRPAVAVPASRAPRVLGGVIIAAVALVLLCVLAVVVWTQLFGDRPTQTKDPGKLGPVALNTPIEGPTPPAVEEDPTKPAVPTTPPVPEPKKGDAAPKNSGDVDLADLPKPQVPANATPLPEPMPKPLPPNPEPPAGPDPEPKGKEAPTVPIVIPGTPATPGVDPARVDAAIAKGVAFLKGQQQGDGSWSGGPPLGYAGLCGLALLECQVPATDDCIRKAADYVRNHVGSNHQVYEISASILFLDRLGDKRDRDLIRNLAMRLLAAQNPCGGWGYVGAPVYAIDPVKMQGYLRTHFPWNLKHPRPATVAKVWVTPGTPVEVAKAKDSNDKGLPAIDMQKLPVSELLWNKWNPYMLNPGDNSNTQFAMLALWAARRHDVPVECGMLLSYARYRKTQNADGGWGYAGPVTLDGFPAHRPVPPGTMIPPGAIPPGFFPAGGAMPGPTLPTIPGPGIAPPGFAPPGVKQPGIPQPGVQQPGVQQPGVQQPRIPQPGVQQPGIPQPGVVPPMNPAGGGMGGGWGTNIATTPTMTCVGLLGLALGHGSVPAGAKAGDDKLGDPAIQKGLRLLAQHIGAPPTPSVIGQPLTQNLYLLWSIERVGVLYDLKTIGGKDWYAWGAPILLDAQAPAGSWGGSTYTGSTGITDTCFALLFLKRSNLMPDLTENLRLQMVIRDPGAR